MNTFRKLTLALFLIFFSCHLLHNAPYTDTVIKTIEVNDGIYMLTKSPFL